MTGTKKQHYVPQLYLRHFSANTGHLFVFDKVTRRSYKSNIRDAGHENHFLTIPELDGEKGAGSHFEAAFQEVEGPAADVLTSVVAAAESRQRLFLDPDVRDTLARFLALQYLRTPEARQRIIETHEGMNRAIAHMIARNNDIDVTQEELHALTRVPDVDRAKIHADFGLNPETIAEVANVLSSHIWRVMINETGMPFYTSDNPLAYHCHAPRPGRGVGIGTYGVEVAFPLTPRLMLCLVHREFARQNVAGWEEREGEVGEADRKNVEYYRWMQVASSRRFLFASTDDFALVHELCETDPELCKVDKQRTEIWAGGELV